jgi:hypothetical protein
MRYINSTDRFVHLQMSCWIEALHQSRGWKWSCAARDAYVCICRVHGNAEIFTLCNVRIPTGGQKSIAYFSHDCRYLVIFRCDQISQSIRTVRLELGTAEWRRMMKIEHFTFSNKALIRSHLHILKTTGPNFGLVYDWFILCATPFVLSLRDCRNNISCIREMRTRYTDA